VRVVAFYRPNNVPAHPAISAPSTRAHEIVAILSSLSDQKDHTKLERSQISFSISGGLVPRLGRYRPVKRT